MTCTPIITTPCGPIQGLYDAEKEMNLFKGIRFATAGRFEYPKKVTHWEGTYQADTFGPASYQESAFFEANPDDFYQKEFYNGETCTYSEDCLFLNISALHKSMRNSDPDAAVYWLCRMLDGGEDPLYIARRLVRFASEDVGMADSHALQLAVATYQACHFLGMPECDVNLTHAVVYLSMAPKSNALYVACEDCKKDVRELPAEPVPLQICNAPTNLMKELHYGQGYIYAHNTEEKLTRMQCLPDSLADRRYYRPTQEGDELQVKEHLDRIQKWKKEKA